MQYLNRYAKVASSWEASKWDKAVFTNIFNESVNKFGVYTIDQKANWWMILRITVTVKFDLLFSISELFKL